MWLRARFDAGNGNSNIEFNLKCNGNVKAADWTDVGSSKCTGDRKRYVCKEWKGVLEVKFKYVSDDNW